MRPDLTDILARLDSIRQSAPADRAVLVGISGIDGSGKGFVTALLADAFRDAGHNVAAINADGWLNLPQRRFDHNRTGEHFYHHAFRMDEMFRRLILPLRDRRCVRLEMDFTEETATAYRRTSVAFESVDIILLEGIFLFKPDWREQFDLTVWVECSFETAMQRALTRAQEGLPPEQTKLAYETTYFPAQRVHFERDQPREFADVILNNDDRQEFDSSTAPNLRLRQA